LARRTRSHREDSRARSQRAKLDQQALFRLTVLTRTRALVDAVADGHCMGAAALELLSVPVPEAADYLIRCQVQPPPLAWQRLAEHLRSAPDSPVSRVLDSPLIGGLASGTAGGLVGGVAFGLTLDLLWGSGWVPFMIAVSQA
jgi:hypothetical protein